MKSAKGLWGAKWTENPWLAKMLLRSETPYPVQSPRYTMNSYPRGAALIISNKRFENDHRERPGTEQDCRKLKLLYEELGFHVSVKEDLKRYEILRECQIFARDPILAKVDCMVLALLSHGTADNVIRYTSYRDTERGSWFIQEFVDVFYEHADEEHVMDMLTEINKRVSKRNYKDNSSEDSCVQIPCPATSLTKKWYMNPPPFATSFRRTIYY
uniref:Caspase-2 n=1 Tax=Magallana gigas TaxID=29159 RepID=K1QA97_MAGGI